MVANYPHLMKYIYSQIQQAQRIPNGMYMKKTTSRKIIFKLSIIKNNEKFLKPVKNKRHDIRRRANQKSQKPKDSGSTSLMY